MIVEHEGKQIKLMTRWCRITHNPDISGYPKTGDKIQLRGHRLIKDGYYIVEAVTEYEPPVMTGGRDIRIKLVGDNGEWNGENIIAAINCAQKEPEPHLDTSYLWEKIRKKLSDFMQHNNVASDKIGQRLGLLLYEELEKLEKRIRNLEKKLSQCD